MSGRRRQRGTGAYQLVHQGRQTRSQQLRRANERDEGAVMRSAQRPPTGSMLLFHAGRPATAQRSAQPTIAEDPAPPPGRAGALVVREQQQGAFPWESKAVRTLAKRVGTRDPNATPMMVEGREGTILAAVGDQSDHQVASEVLKWHQTQRRQAQLADAAAQGVGDGIDASGAGPLERMSRRERQQGAGRARTLGRDDAGDRQLAVVDKPRSLARQRRGRRGGAVSGNDSKCGGTLAVHDDTPPFSFGAVYEHRDAFGVPRYVGETGDAPEIAFQADMEHKGVRKTVKGGGSSQVVWAGFGSGPVGATQMEDMRKAVQHVRAERLQAAKLSSVKPYSAHGAIGIELD